MIQVETAKLRGFPSSETLNTVELAPNDNSRRAATLCRQQAGSGKSRHGDADLLLNSTALPP